MKIVKSLALVVIILALLGFVGLVFIDVPVKQEPVSKEISNERFFNSAG